MVATMEISATFSFTLIFILVVLIALIYIRWKIVYGTFRNLGILGPKPQLYYGNAKDIKKKGLLKFFEECALKFGNIYGYYNGVTPVLVVSDLEMIRQIGIKQFDVFMDRPQFPDLLRPKGTSKVSGLLNSQGEDWKRRRKILSKSFNTINLNRMSSLIEVPCISLCDKIDELSSQKSIDIFRYDFNDIKRSLYSLYTMEVILSTGFGHKVNVIDGGEEDELTTACASVFAAFREGSEIPSIVTLLSNFPNLKWFVRHITLRSNAAQNFSKVETNVKDLVEKRLQSIDNDEKVPQDVLQLLIDAKAEDDEIDIKQKKLSSMEVVRTGISFLLAGYETTSNALGFTTYLLALHPKEQDKLYQEIKEYYQNHPDAALNEVAHNIPYLDMVIQESLRMYPPAPRFGRYCSQTVDINGVTIPKGCNVEVPVYMIHHSSEHWPDPEEFKPERFTKEEKDKRHPLAHIPFGLGPRSCIGMRLALMEAKMALVSILSKFELIESPDTEKPLSLHLGITMIPKNGVWVRVRKR